MHKLICIGTVAAAAATALIGFLPAVSANPAGRTFTGTGDENAYHRLQQQQRRDGPEAHQYRVNKNRAHAVKKAFDISWDGYYKYAFPHDSLRPINNSWFDDRFVLLFSLLLYPSLNPWDFFYICVVP